MECNDEMKEVYFDQYCRQCKHVDCGETEDPCYECLDEPVNYCSHKPVYFEERK